MNSFIPSDTVVLVHSILSRVAGSSNDLPVLYPVGGGSINDTCRILTKDGRQWFCKINDAAVLPDLFQKEMQGLGLLQQQGIFRIPHVIACESAIGFHANDPATANAFTKQVLLLEWIEQGPRNESFWRNFGERLARLHRITWSAVMSSDPISTGTEPRLTAAESDTTTEFFGLDIDNYMGALPQYNTHLPQTPFTSWVDFFVQRRLEPQTYI